MLVLPATAHGAPPGDNSKDLAAFIAPESAASRVLPLATQNPKVGDDVWLVAEVRGGRSVGTHLHRARVVESKRTTLAYTFEDPTLELRATSGAPVVNAKGEVVGVNLGGGHQGDSLYGVAHPVQSVRAHLEGRGSAP
ncbi:trypsin-like peptidase domain-containing protein [Aggregicoccus sp. 17bor-14]|uniref:trypsin-like peptidase domain-containing protein n=1 Tax=Myxococcaceae TaxID=31 RepID=UPI00129CD7B0|nr:MULTISPECIES: trypsin-like peptidase domain-containing protein [Myxococcaceae]MBF5043372.1 hypothetical protein [Simulacricoccus sp. 17bor-14]MRI89130.1 trypsin-like peptidase domain-containing protein [Aggregicoccus sp. 17bor-14]